MGAPSTPIRLTVSLLILKHVRNFSDENVAEQWSENNYFEYFSSFKLYGFLRIHFFFPPILN
jgi:hypothetical protein